MLNSIFLFWYNLSNYLFRETDWLFGSNEGRRQLADSAKYQRLLVVHLGRDHQFVSLDFVQNELAGIVSSLQPQGLPPNTQVYFCFAFTRKA